MSRFHKHSTNDKKQHYMKPLFWSNPDNQFWRSSRYTQKYQDFANNLVHEFESQNRVILNLIENIK